MEEKCYSTNQVAEILNTSTSTILRLCRSGVVPNVRRNRRYHRMFEEWQINHIRVLLGLRRAGLNNAELKRYARLVRQGSSSLAERKAIFETKKRQLWQELEDLQQGIDFLERQIEDIDQKLH